MSYYLPPKPNPLNLDVKEPAWKSLIQKLDMVSYHCSMPVLENVQVSLTEVLEVRGQSLEEWELWSVLFQTTEAVQDTCLKGQACKDGVPQFLVTPDNVHLTSFGRIVLNICTPEKIAETKYWCPEMSDPNFCSNTVNLDKIYVYTIGQTMLHAAYYNNDRIEKRYSPLFKAVLQAMCQKDDDLRMVLADISEVCNIHGPKHMDDYSFHDGVIALHREVLGSLPENEILDQVNQDTIQENNEVEEVEYEEDDPFEFINYDSKHFSYGHRLGYYPDLDIPTRTKKKSKNNPKERWKRAYQKVLKEIQKAKLPMDDRAKIMEEWKQHKAHETIFRVYEELIERRRMLELLRLSINIGPSGSVNMGKNPFLMAGLKPKTVAELVLLLQRPPPQPGIGNASSSSDIPKASDNLSLSSELLQSMTDGNYNNPYYALHKLVSKIPLQSSDIDTLPGPRFIVGRLKPTMKISLFPNDSLEYQSSVVNVSISLLTGEFIEVECLPSTTGKQLFQAVSDHIKLQERYLFGLACESDGEYIFIDRKQRIMDFVQDSTATESIHSLQMVFRVKFYLEDIHLMRTQTLRHLFYLQLRKDFLDSDFGPDIKLALTLGSLALQTEFGDYETPSHGNEYFLLEHYFPFQCTKQINRVEAKKKLQNQHASLRGISKDLAEVKFIQNMMQLPEYGTHFHSVMQEKKNTSSIVYLGIKPKGIEVYEFVSGKKSICQNYPWQNILRISFSKKCFCLAPRSESITGKHVVYRFYTTSLNRSIYLFNIAMAHHKFYLKLKSVTKASEIFFDDFDAENFYVVNKSEIEKEVGCDLYDSEGNLQVKGPKTLKHKSSTPKVSSFRKASFTDLTNLQLFKNLLPCLEDVIILSSKGSGRIKRKKKHPHIVMRSSSDPVKKNYSSLSNRVFSAKDISSCVPNAFSNDSSRKPALKFVRLHKDPKLGLGMVITCGDSYDTILHGSFIESVYPGSPAALNGNISPGDQIMSVNGTNVQNDYFLSVVDLIQCSNSPVDLVLAKSGKSLTDTSICSPKEIIEKPFKKTKAWIVGDETSDATMKIEEHVSGTDTPVPKPRKKLSKKSSEGLQLDGPDLTLNHSKQSSGNKSLNNEPNSNFISDVNAKNWGIPDIIASQIKNVDSEFVESSKCDDDNSEENEDEFRSLDENDLLPGEVYHVVLDKKGGSLGLNIFQGTEPATSLQKHIYIHSIIPDGAAELDGRIKPGDKLLEVNGILLENLSYQEVVTTLRESPQVTHLVLEKGIGFVNKPEDDFSQSCLNSLLFKTDQILAKDDETTDYLNKALDSIDSYSFYESFEKDDSNVFSSLPTCLESTLNGAKESSSTLSSYQHSDHLQNKGRLSSSSVDDLDISKKSEDSFVSSHAKDNFQNGLSSYKSTPNLNDSSDEEENRTASAMLYKNRSTDCLAYSSQFINPHQALFDLYENYPQIRGSSCNIHQIPAVPIRKKKLKKLEDIYNYCNIENTFTVKICKSSRGLGLSISGGRDASRKDPFSQLIQIRKLYPLQPALECGKLALGDVILEVNGISMLGLTNTEALEVLRTVPTDVELKIFRPSKSLLPSFSVFKGGIWPGFNSSSSSASSSLSRTENTYNVETGEFEVTLMKRDGSLGFTIFRRDNIKDSAGGIYVKALVREHAVSDGRIQPGDKILQVNGTDVSNLSHSEAIACLRNTSEKVTLKLFRDDPPLPPYPQDEDYTITKPLRREAVELLNDRVKQKDLNEDSGTLKRKLKRRLDRSSNAPSNSSTESVPSSSSDGQDHVKDEKDESLAKLDDEPALESGGLNRNLRPKSLDVLNSSDRKRLIGHSDEDSFRRQASVMCNVESKSKNENDESNGTAGKKGNLLKWRGSTLHDTEQSNSIDLIQDSNVLSSKTVNIERKVSTENKPDEDDYKPVPFPRSTSYANELVHTFDVSLDRGWHLRLGFSIWGPINGGPDSPRNVLPDAAEVKAVYPGSLADKDGRIKVGDRILEVNGESLLGKKAHEVIDILRKTRGVIRMVFCRLQDKS